MMTKIKLFGFIAVLVMAGTIWIQQKRITNIKAERDRQTYNNDVLLSEIEQWKIDSTTMATDVKSLRFTLDEMERYRAEDLTKIEQMGVKIKDLEAMAKHDIVVDAPIEAQVRDSVIIRDSIPVISKVVQMTTPHISIDAVIENDTLIGSVNLPVTLRQAVWVEYKRRCLFWRRPVAVHQTITSDNPYVQINYSEYINIHK
ncbi:MAG: DUF6549 family protein [Rikenellaceae bacterium]